MENGISQSPPTPQRAPVRSRDQWRDIYDTWQSSELTRRDFCDTQGLRYSTFRRWCQRFRKDTGSHTAAAPVTPPFVNLGPAAQPHWEIELTLGPDVVLRMRRS